MVTVSRANNNYERNIITSRTSLRSSSVRYQCMDSWHDGVYFLNLYTVLWTIRFYITRCSRFTFVKTSKCVVLSFDEKTIVCSDFPFRVWICL